jgi:hypothetical protein
MSVKGKRQSRFFADVGYGGKAKSLKAAKVYRDELLANRPVRKSVPRPIMVVRNGSKWVQIRVKKAAGGTSTTEFSVRTHGAKKAKELAIKAWRAAEKRSDGK